MAAIQKIVREAFFSPTSRRTYFTAHAAAKKEAAALIRRKYPNEEGDLDENGYLISDSWHWTSDQRLIRLHRRLTRLIVRDLKRTKEPA